MPRPPLPIQTHGEINATQISKGRWEARTRFRDFDGKTREKRRVARTKTAAENAVREAVRDHLGVKGDDALSGESRLRQLADVWWQEYRASKDVPAGTLNRYRGVLEKHIKAGIGDRRLQECTVSSLDKFLKVKTATVGYSTASIAAVLLRGMFDLAARHDAIDRNPMLSVAAIPKPTHTPTAFTLKDIGELRRILRAWDAGTDRRGLPRISDLADPVDMFLGTGWRPGEIFATEWECIDFTADPVRVVLGATMAKDEHSRWRIQRHRKNHKTISTPIPKFTAQMLLRRRVNSLGTLVFPSSKLTPRIPDNFRTQWHAALVGTRFEGRLPKEFRATVATLLRDEVGIEAAQHQLNHAHRSTTEDRYAVPLTVLPDHTAVLEQFDVLAD